MPDENIPLAGAEASPTPEVETKPEDSTNKIAEMIQGLSDEVKAIGTEVTGVKDELTVLKTEATPEPEPEPKAEGWKPKTWEEIPEKVEETTRQATRDEILKIEEERFQKAKEDSERAAAAAAEINNQFDEQLDKMVKENVLPPIVNPEDANDPGRTSRRLLFMEAAKYGTLNLEAVQQDIEMKQKAGLVPEITDDNKVNWVNRGVPYYQAKNAPVGSSGGRSLDVAAAPTREQLQKMGSLDDIARAHGLG